MIHGYRNRRGSSNNGALGGCIIGRNLYGTTPYLEAGVECSRMTLYIK